MPGFESLVAAEAQGPHRLDQLRVPHDGEEDGEEDEDGLSRRRRSRLCRMRTRTRNAQVELPECLCSTAD